MNKTAERPVRETAIKANAATAFIDLLTQMVLKQRQQRNSRRS